MKTLVYKRTHIGDPDGNGILGIKDCLGRMRSCDFEAAIGIGGTSSHPRAVRIDGKVNWIGIGSQKGAIHGRGPLVTFEHFVLYNQNGKDFRNEAPILAGRMYATNAPRFVFSDNLSKAEQDEIDRLLAMAKTAKPSASGGHVSPSASVLCKPPCHGSKLNKPAKVEMARTQTPCRKRA